jgi:hypothetical protein
MNQYWTVVELYDNKVSQVILCENDKDGQEVFERIVAEYGVEITDEDYEDDGSGIFEDDDGYIVQLVKCN